MSQYLLEKDVELKSKTFAEADIYDILIGYYEYKDEFFDIFKRFQISKEGEFLLTEDEIHLIKDELTNDYHLLIKAILNNFLIYSNEKESTKLHECCKEYITEYFNENSQIDFNIPARNLTILIKWIIKKVSRYKKEISNLLLDKIEQGDVEDVRYILLVDHLFSNKDSVDIFNYDQYIAIFKEYLIDIANLSNINSYLEIYKKYYEFILNHKKKNNDFFERYCNFVINNISLIDNRIKPILLQNIRDLMNELKDFSDDEYYVINENLEKANAENLKLMKKIEVSIPKEKLQPIIEYAEKQNTKFLSLSNIDKLDELLIEIFPLSKERIKNDLDSTNKSSFISLFPKRIIENNGRVINYKKLDEESMFSLEICSWVPYYISTCFVVLIDPFFKNFIVDDSIKCYIRKILSNNKLVSNDRIDLLADNFITFLNKDYKNSVYDIVLELEESFRFYFKNEKMNIYMKDRKNNLIGINEIFNNKSNNSYRDKLFEIIDEDYYFTIKWFLVDDYGFNLRNKIAHRINLNYAYNDKNSIYICFMILRLYWFFQND